MLWRFRRFWPLAFFPGCLALVVGLFVVVLLLVKLLWAWTVPDLFPGAVNTGLIAAHISWWTALKLAVFLAVLLGIAGAGGASR
jgi:hypothetical protein